MFNYVLMDVNENICVNQQYIETKSDFNFFMSDSDRISRNKISHFYN